MSRKHISLSRQIWAVCWSLQTLPKLTSLPRKVSRSLDAVVQAHEDVRLRPRFCRRVDKRISHVYCRIMLYSLMSIYRQKQPSQRKHLLRPGSNSTETLVLACSGGDHRTELPGRGHPVHAATSGSHLRQMRFDGKVHFGVAILFVLTLCKPNLAGDDV